MRAAARRRCPVCLACGLCLQIADFSIVYNAPTPPEPPAGQQQPAAAQQERPGGQGEGAAAPAPTAAAGGADAAELDPEQQRQRRLQDLAQRVCPEPEGTGVGGNSRQFWSQVGALERSSGMPPAPAAVQAGWNQQAAARGASPRLRVGQQASGRRVFPRRAVLCARCRRCCSNRTKMGARQSRRSWAAAGASVARCAFSHLQLVALLEHHHARTHGPNHALKPRCMRAQVRYTAPAEEEEESSGSGSGSGGDAEGAGTNKGKRRRRRKPSRTPDPSALGGSRSGSSGDDFRAEDAEEEEDDDDDEDDEDFVVGGVLHPEERELLQGSAFAAGVKGAGKRRPRQPHQRQGQQQHQQQPGKAAGPKAMRGGRGGGRGGASAVAARMRAELLQRKPQAAAAAAAGPGGGPSPLQNQVGAHTNAAQQQQMALRPGGPLGSGAGAAGTGGGGSASQLRQQGSGGAPQEAFLHPVLRQTSPAHGLATMPSGGASTGVFPAGPPPQQQQQPQRAAPPAQQPPAGAAGPLQPHRSGGLRGSSLLAAAGVPGIFFSARPSTTQQQQQQQQQQRNPTQPSAAQPPPPQQQQAQQRAAVGQQQPQQPPKAQRPPHVPPSLLQVHTALGITQLEAPAHLRLPQTPEQEQALRWWASHQAAKFAHRTVPLLVATLDGSNSGSEVLGFSAPERSVMLSAVQHFGVPCECGPDGFMKVLLCGDRASTLEARERAAAVAQHFARVSATAYSRGPPGP